MKQFLSKLLNIICVLMIVLAIVILSSALIAKKTGQTNIFGYSIYRVLTPSMEPVIMTDSVIVVKEADASEVAVGDIITFWSRDPSIAGSTNTHRVIAVDNTSGTPVFTTKGDNNYVEDKYQVYPEDIVGKVVFISSNFGKIISFVSNPICFGILVIIPLGIIFILNVKDLIVTAKRLEAQEIEGALKADSEKDKPEQ